MKRSTWAVLVLMGVGFWLTQRGRRAPAAPEPVSPGRLVTVGGAAPVILFAYDSAAIEPESYPVLDRVASMLALDPSLTVEIHGHTDNIGSTQFNLDLSYARAYAVLEYLVSAGVTNTMDAIGYGESQPVATNQTELGRASNRRVEIYVR